MPEAAGGRVRIWHQSITDLEALPHYREALRRTAASAVDAEVVVHGVSPGTYPPGLPPVVALRSPWVEQLLSVQVVVAAERAEAEGFDAVAVSCFYDPGLREARAAVAIPVVSACESALLAAGACGMRAGLLALDEWHARSLRALVEGYGQHRGVCGVVVLDPPVDEHELEAGLEPVDLLDRLERAAAAAVRAGAEVVVPAEGVLSGVVAEAGLGSLAGAPVLDGLATVLARAELLVRLQRATGLRRAPLGRASAPGGAVVDAAARAAAAALADRPVAGPGRSAG